MELSTTNVVTVNKNVFQLMKLPLELRIMIYKLSLDYNSGTFNTICQWVHAYSDVVHVVLRRLHRAQSLCYSVFRDDSRCWPETYLPKFNTPTCLLISKTVHAEALPELRKQPFVFGPDFGHLSLQCSEIISPASLACLERIHFSATTLAGLRAMMSGPLVYGSKKLEGRYKRRTANPKHVTWSGLLQANADSSLRVVSFECLGVLPPTAIDLKNNEHEHEKVQPCSQSSNSVLANIESRKLL